MVIFTFFLFAMMLIVGGMSIDIMRFETSRARMQAALDRAVLAAADLSVCLDPAQNTEEMVEDFVTRAGFAGQLEKVTVVKSTNSCGVSAEASLEINTIFLSALGVDHLKTGAGSAATEAMSEAEISLVVDVSGSMGGSRINALRPAAVNFVNTIYDSFEVGSVSMSLIPYSTQVSLGENVLDAFENVDQLHDYSYCLDLPGSAYDAASIDMDAAYPHAGHVDIDGYAYNRSYWDAQYFVCDPSANAEIIVHAHQASTLVTRINALQANAWTSIEMGAKWGVALLDPSTADLTTHLNSVGVVDDAVANRPLEYGLNSSLKILVLMTDGANTQSYELDDDLKSGLSDIYYDADDDLYYVDDEENGNRDYDSRSYEDYFRPDYDNWTNSLPSDAVRLTWPEFFNQINLEGHAWYFRYEQRGGGHNYNSWYSGKYDTINSTTKNNRMDAVCDAAKDNGIIIFTIGFQVSGSADQVMADCASSPSYYYDVDSLDIDAAFSSIATQISALRLIQ